MKARSSTAGSTEPSYSDCKICGGDGWILHEDDGHRTSEPCICRKKKIALQRIRNSGLERLLADCTLDRFEAKTSHARLMKDAAVKYIQDITGGGEGWLYIGGAVGCGKTHICTAICGALIEAGRSVRYMEWLPTARKFKAMIGEVDADDLLGKYIDADVLYIDDLFKMQHLAGQLPRPTESDIRIAFELVNHRYNAKKPTLITSEWYMAELMDIDEGTFSRVYQVARDYAITIGREAGKNWRTL